MNFGVCGGSWNQPSSDTQKWLHKAEKWKTNSGIFGEIGI